MIDGREEQCLVLPIKQNQIKKGKRGGWYFICRLAESEPNARSQTHDIQLTYLTEEDLQKSYDFGYHKRTAHMGRVYEHDRTPEKKLDRTNRVDNICLDGVIVLSDIRKSEIYISSQNNRRYLSNLVFRGLPDDGRIYVGSICIDDIDSKHILTDPTNGKKKINTRLKKIPKMDVYGNTHELVMVTNDGHEIQIGLFREFHSQNGIQTPPPQAYNQQQTNNQRNTPMEIGGIKF